MKCAKYVAFFMVCLLACSSAWAIGGIKRETATPQQDVLVAIGTTQSSENEASVKYVTSEELLEILNKAGWFLGGEKLDKVIDGVNNIEKTNQEQNDEIDRLRKALEHEQKGTKYFADLGAAFGFKSEKVQYGVVGDMGFRFGQGLLVKTGVQYMLGNVGKLEMPSWSMDNLTVSATVGWEW